MARPIVLSNGELHVGLNTFGLVHDFYYPYVGLENHSAGADLKHLVGVWIDGSIYWLDNGDWEFLFRYPQTALVGHTIAKNEKIGLVIEFDDFVDADLSAYLRNIHIINLWDHPREVRLFMHQSFAIGDSRSNTDTAQYLPDNDAILHYRGRRAFVVSGEFNGERFDQYTVGLFGIEGHEGSFRDADDGELGFGNVEHGRVDSVLRFRVQLNTHSSERIHYWIAAGTSIREALYVHSQIQKDGLLKRLQYTADWWHEWLGPAINTAKKVPAEHQDSFLRSIMIIKSQIDKRGAVIASTDTTMLNYSRDAYAYCWPRDASLVLWPLIRIGYKDEPRWFFEFCKRALHPNGYLMHKYRADGALGSSWHPYIHGDIVAPPIQEDETALVLYMFAEFYQINPDAHLLHDFYSTLIEPMANFLSEYTDESTGLPKPTYNLWEEHFITSTYTTSVVHAALLAGSELAAAYGDDKNAVKWKTAADDIQQAAHRYLYNPKSKSFYKGVHIKEGGKVEPDETIDTSSAFGAFLFGLYPPESEEISQAVDSLCQRFSVQGDVYGLPRYENDHYRRVSDDVTGNWWPITSLWLAQYYIHRDRIHDSMRILDWIQDQMLHSGILAEQISPLNNEPLSVAPLAWSHAEYLSTFLDLINEESKNETQDQ